MIFLAIYGWLERIEVKASWLKREESYFARVRKPRFDWTHSNGAPVYMV